MGIQISIMSPLFTIDSDSVSPNAELVVLVCSQCSTTRHSACLWRCISHLVFGIQPVDSLMFSWHTECHQTMAAKTQGHLAFSCKRAVHYVSGSECVHTSECVFRWVPWIEIECDCLCMHMLRKGSQQMKPGWWRHSHAVCHSPRWRADPTVLPVVPTTSDLSRCETGVSAWLGVLLCSCSWGVNIKTSKEVVMCAPKCTCL